MNVSKNATKVQEPPANKTRAKRIKIIVALVAVVVVAVAGAVFKPWLLFVDTHVNDEIPQVVASNGQDRSATGVDGDDTSHSGESGGPTLLAQGSFISHEHTTTGTASIVHYPETGKNQLVLTDLATSNGPDVHVWLSKAPVISGKDGWFVAGEHEHVDLGEIKGNLGNQVYDLPEGTNVNDWTSVVLWCEDFSVSFGAAELSAQQ